jgi:prepilin-type processing-associated H-X9-DG protein
LKTRRDKNSDHDFGGCVTEFSGWKRNGNHHAFTLFLNFDAARLFGGSQARIFHKDSDITQPGPSMTSVLIDENANPIDDGYFAGILGSSGKWINVPPTRHGNSSGLSFADGHSEIKRWGDNIVISQNVTNLTLKGGPTYASDPSSGDNAWLEQRESVLQ